MKSPRQNPGVQDLQQTGKCSGKYFLQKLPCHAGKLHFTLIDSSLKKRGRRESLGAVKKSVQTTLELLWDTHLES